jgi:predicted ester cyclase
MASTSNKQIVQHYVAAFNAGDMDRLQTLFAPDALIYGVLGWGALDVAIPIWRELHAAFAIELTIDGIIAEGDVVAARYVERGNYIAPFRGKEPTGKSYELVAMEWFQIRDGRIYRRWGARDAAAQARQLGI